jgi:hypothetical protein
MTVKELKDAIANLPDNMEVIVQKDAEGNDFSPLSGVDPDVVYEPESTWSGYIYDPNMSADDAGFSEEEWEEIKLREKALVLYPIN